MLWLRNLLYILCLITITACGFTPVYKKGVQQETLASISIEAAENSREQLQLKARLEDVLAPAGQLTPRYHLVPNMNITIEQLSIDSDGITRRYRIFGTVAPTLTDLETGEVVMRSTIQRFNSYNISDADYSTYVTAQDSKERLVQALADEIRLKLISHFN